MLNRHEGMKRIGLQWVSEADYDRVKACQDLVDNELTLCEAETRNGIPKSTIHWFYQKHLKDIAPGTYLAMRNQLRKNKNRSRENFRKG